MADLVLHRRLVTLADLPREWAGVGRVVVPPGAVVTPSVNDLLREKGLPLVRQSAAEAPAARVRVALAAHGGDVEKAGEAVALLAKALAGEGFPVERSNMACLMAASDQLALAVREANTAGVLVTRHAAVAICLLNRLPGVRALDAGPGDDVLAAAAAIGANVLVVHRRALAGFAARRTVQEFVRGAPRACPAVFENRLG